MIYRDGEDHESMNQMMGNLFGRGQPTEGIKRMSYSEMKYWNRWHTLMSDQETKTARELKDAAGGK